jgi:hypothetical protein
MGRAPKIALVGGLLAGCVALGSLLGPYENEAWNSWHITTGPFDPYGFCPDLS